MQEEELIDPLQRHQIPRLLKPGEATATTSILSRSSILNHTTIADPSNNHIMSSHTRVSPVIHLPTGAVININNTVDMAPNITKLTQATRNQCTRSIIDREERSTVGEVEEVSK